MSLQTIGLFSFFIATDARFFPFFSPFPKHPRGTFRNFSPATFFPASFPSLPRPPFPPRSASPPPLHPSFPFLASCPVPYPPDPASSAFPPALFRHTPPFLSLFLSRLLFLSDFSPAPPPLRRAFFRFLHPVFSPFHASPRRPRPLKSLFFRIIALPAPFRKKLPNEKYDYCL